MSRAPGMTGRGAKGDGKPTASGTSVTHFTRPAFDRLVDALADYGVRSNGTTATARCPAHDDRNPSLSVRCIEGQVLIYCHAGCDTRDVLAAVGLGLADLYDDQHGTAYRYDDGRVVHRTPDKRFRQSGNTAGMPQLYRLANVRDAVRAGQPVWLVEGEKDVHALESLGAVATTAPMGANNIRTCDLSPLSGAEVLAVHDQDDAGHRWAQLLRERLDGKAGSLAFYAPKAGNDPADHIAAGYGLDDFALVEVAGGSAGEIVQAGGLELDAFLNATPPDYDWLIPELLERGDRVILTGPEGGGKSTLLRQFGVQAASGIHPFDDQASIPPLRVVLIDLENSPRQVQRALRPLRVAAGDKYAGGMFVRVRAEGIDLMKGDGAWLEALVAEARPDLLITGPSYKLSSGDPTEEHPAKIVAGWLDKLRVTYRCAVLLEAHSPHGGNGKGQRRPERPYGAALWLRWPEFGLHLSAEGDLRHWRGPRDERDWPALLQRGGAWPWTPVTQDRDLLWAEIKALCIAAEDQLHRRDLIKMTGKSSGAVTRAIDEHRAEWDTLAGGDTG